MIHPPQSLDGRIGCSSVRSDSVYQQEIQSLPTETSSGLVVPNPSRFICTFEGLNNASRNEKLHICRI